LGIISCKKEVNQPGPGTKPKLYVVTTQFEANTLTVRYFKDTSAIFLDPAPGYNAGTAIAVQDENVYIAGYDLITHNGISVTHAKFWKNGIPTVLSDSNENSTAYAMALSGNDVYVAGFDYKNRPVKAVYWKNSSPVILTNSLGDANAFAIAVSGNDVHVAGVIWPDSTNITLAVYWKNGQLTKLGQDTMAVTSGIFLAGSDVYISGYAFQNGHYIACYWKNGSIVKLTDGSVDAYAKGIVLHGNDVYVCGFQTRIGNFHSAVIWKNGQENIISDPATDAFANAIALDGSNIYVAGMESGGARNEIAKYWLNGKAVELGDNNGGDSFATGLFLEK
ncbi:MAG TPA: hypothetical protein VK622_16900, partial [Puia sp.]|nr:hypothetical protein [Puia sp.]